MTLLHWQLGYPTLLSGLCSIYLWWWGLCVSVLCSERKYGGSDETHFCLEEAIVTVGLRCNSISGWHGGGWVGGRRGSWMDMQVTRGRRKGEREGRKESRREGGRKKRTPNHSMMNVTFVHVTLLPGADQSSSLVPRPSIAGGRPGIHCLRMRLISPKILENRISRYSSVKR